MLRLTTDSSFGISNVPSALRNLFVDKKLQVISGEQFRQLFARSAAITPGVPIEEAFNSRKNIRDNGRALISKTSN